MSAVVCGSWNAYQITIARPSSDGKFIAAGELYQSKAHIFDATNGRVLAETPASHDLLTDLAYAPHGKAMALAFANGHVEYFEIESDANGSPAITRRPLVLTAHEGLVVSLRFVDDRTLVTSGADGLIRIWNLPASLDRGYDVCDSTINDMKVSPDGRFILCTSAQEYSITDAKSGDVVFHHRDSSKEFCAPAWSPSGDKAVVCCRIPGTALVLSPSGQQMQSIAYPDQIRGAAISPDGSTIAIIGDKQIQVCRIDSSRPQFRQDLAEVGNSTTFSHNGARLAYGGKLGKIVLINAANLQLEREIGCPREARCMEFSPDDRLLATGHTDSMIRVWEVETGRLRAQLVGHERALHDLAFSPDSRTLLSAADDGEIRLWSVDHGRAYGTFYQRFDNGANHVFCQLGLPSDGRYLAAGYGTDRPNGADVYVWDLVTTSQK